MRHSKIVLTALVLGWLVSPAGADPLARLEYKDDRLTLKADQTPIGDVLDALKRESHAELRGELPTGDVTATLDAVPLRDALGRLLGDQSFTLTYGEGDTLKAIDLKGGPVPSSRAQAPAPATASAYPHGGFPGMDVGKGPPHWEVIGNTLTMAGPVSVDGKLKDLAGGERASWQLLVSTAYRNEDAALREDAIRAAVRGIEDDPSIRDTIIGTLTAMDNEALANFARTAMAGSALGPDTLLKLVAQSARSAELRTRARQVLRQLRLDIRAERAARGAV